MYLRKAAKQKNRSTVRTRSALVLLPCHCIGTGALSLFTAITFFQLEISSNQHVTLVPDPDFHPVIATPRGVSLNVAVAEPGNTIILAGYFNLLGDVPANGVVRLTPAGLVDQTFQSWPGTRGVILAACSLPDKRLILGGQFSVFNGQTRTSLVRLNSNGSLDTSFDPLIGGRDPTVHVIRMQQDGRILIGGRFKLVDGVDRSCVARLTQEGRLDHSFDPGDGAEDSFAVVYDIAIQTDGKILVAGLFTKFAGQSYEGLVRLLPDGRIDTSFSTEVKWSFGLACVRSVLLDERERILIGGRFDSVNAELRRGLARLMPDGELDLSFEASDGITGLGEPTVTVIRLTRDRKIIVGGQFTEINGVKWTSIARLSESGIPDASFNCNSGLTKEDETAGTVHDVALLEDGSLIVVGDFCHCENEVAPGLVRIMPDGLPDTGFVKNVGRPLKVGSVNAIAPQAGGGYIVGGHFGVVNGLERHALAHVTSTGKLNTEFNAAFAENSIVNTIVCLEKDQVLVGGEFELIGTVRRVNIARLDADGTLDVEFNPGSGPDGPVYALAMQEDGCAVVGGAFVLFNGHLRPGLARVNWCGELDEMFAPMITYRNGPGEVYTLVVESSGRILAGGFFDAVDGKPASGLVRLMPNGQPDPTFGKELEIDGKTVQILALVVQDDGKIVIAGAFEHVNGYPRRGIARLQANGALDHTFNPGSGIEGGEFPIVYAVQAYTDASLLLAGEFNVYNGLSHANIARANRDGSVVNSSSAARSVPGADAVINVLLPQPDGKVLVGGAFTQLGHSPNHALARLKPVPLPTYTLHIKLEAGVPTLYWEGQAKLQKCTSLTGTWQDIPGAISPYRVNSVDLLEFFRLIN